MTAHFEVLACGPQVLVQDLGRDLAEWGVARSGAADRRALALGNRLVGNRATAAGLESLMGGVALRLTSGGVVAVTGADCPVVVAGRAVDMNRSHRLEPGAVLEVGSATSGLRVYVSMRGGIAVEPVMGSRSRDVLAQVGPEPLVPGARVPLGDNYEREAWNEFVVPPRPLTALRVAPGPRADWFSPAAAHALTSTSWTVQPASDRTGVRLSGKALGRRIGDLPSEPTVIGAIQVPPDGQPIVLGPDAGVSGGYPVLAVVLDADVDALAQVRPGEQVRFRWA